MTRAGEKSRLRNTLRKLAAIPGGDTPERAQEALDLLAMMSGLKPVYLMGRGIDDAAWVTGVREIARGLGLHAVEGPYWNAAAGTEGLPDWFAAHVRGALSGRTAWYVCRARAVASELRALAAAGAPDIAREARLLGYPVCCVTAHYARTRAYQEVWLDLLRRRAGGDEAAMRRLLADGAALDPETEVDRRRLEEAMAVTPCPFTSIDMCAACAADPEGPARRLSGRYAALAASIDAGLALSLRMRADRGVLGGATAPRDGSRL